MCRLFINCSSLKLLSPKGLFRPVMSYRYTFILVFHTIVSLAKRLQKKGVIKLCVTSAELYILYTNKETTLL